MRPFRWIPPALAGAMVFLLPISSVMSMDPGDEQLVAAFDTTLSGNPEVDFRRVVNTHETVTVYLIAGPVAETTRTPIELDLHLVSSLDAQAPPDYTTCAGAGTAFDDSAASPLDIVLAPTVPVRTVSWGAVKQLYR